MLKQTLIGLAGAAALGGGFAGSAEAASFNFSYTLQDGDLLAGMLEGDILGDGDTVAVASFDMVTFNGAPTFDLTFIDSVFEFAGGPPGEPLVSLSGATMDIIACTSPCVDGFLFDGNGAVFGAPAYSSGDTFGGALEVYNPDNWMLSLKTDPASVPEPASLLGLLAIGAVAAGGALKKKAPV